MLETLQEQNKVSGVRLEKDPKVHSGDRAGDQHSYGPGDCRPQTQLKIFSRLHMQDWEFSGETGKGLCGLVVS